MYEWESNLCPQCGGPSYLCSDPERTWWPSRTICYRTAVTRGANRLWAKKNEKEDPDGLGMLPTDGTVVFASPVDLDPNNEDDFLGLAAGPHADLHDLRDPSTE